MVRVSLTSGDEGSDRWKRSFGLRKGVVGCASGASCAALDDLCAEWGLKFFDMLDEVFVLKYWAGIVG